MKLLRTIRLDPSDTFVFERAAEPGEWAVSGAFMFADADPEALDGKPRAAFRGGFLGVASFGWSTLVQIVEASEDDRAAVVEMLGRQFHERLGAPDLAAARAAAEEEVAFAASLCDRAARHADRGAPHLRGRRDPRSLPQLASARRPQADAGVLVPRRGGRGGAGRRGRSRHAGEGAESWPVLRVGMSLKSFHLGLA